MVVKEFKFCAERINFFTMLYGAYVYLVLVAQLNHNLIVSKESYQETIRFLFLAFDFCRFCVIIRCFHPRHNGQWPPTLKGFLSQILSITFFVLSLFLRKSQYFPFNVECQTRELLVPFHYVFGMTRSLSGDWTRDLLHSKPALYHLAIEEAVQKTWRECLILSSFIDLSSMHTK